jgi:predicted RNA-binding protein with PIN domain
MRVDPPAARAQLEKMLRPLADPPASEVLVVYDAQSRAAQRQGVSAREAQPGLTVEFSRLQEADTSIIEQAELLHSAGEAQNVFVITHDNRIKDAVLEQGCTPAGLELLQSELRAAAEARRRQAVLGGPPRSLPSMHADSAQWARAVLGRAQAADAGAAAAATTAAAARRSPAAKRPPPVERRAQQARQHAAAAAAVDVDSINLDALLSRKNADLLDIDSLLDGLI